MKFSIIVVSLNAGEKLNNTLNSILQQTYSDFEVVVKDGNSTDGSIEGMTTDNRIHLIQEADNSIYDAMNQALKYVTGDYVLFLNCGDSFYDSSILEKTAAFVLHAKEKNMIFYGDTFCEKTQSIDAAVPHITGLSCYRNIPCHQSCFYHASLFEHREYETALKIRADYDHFLWCYYVKQVQPAYMGFIVASYEGEGFSESDENQKRDKEEHKMITKRYMSKGELFKYQTIMVLTLVHLRHALADSKAFAGMYHKLKQFIYRRK